MRIGIFGGSFDPVHTGHLIVAECCREQASLDRVLFVPAAIAPHKQDRSLAAGSHRLAMLALATGGQASFGISSDEVDRGGVSYSVETLQRLSLQYSGDELLLILGPDALADLPTWREPEKILSLSKLIAVERAGIDTIATVLATAALASLLGPDGVAAVVASRVICSAIGIRASDLRSAVAAGRSIRYRTPRAVEQYIASHQLYRTD